MSREVWLAKLSEWRSREEKRAPAAITLLANNALVLGTILAAWPDAAPGLRIPGGMPPEDDRAAWDALWLNEPEMVRAVVEATSLPEREVRMGLRVLVANRVIYPDGTISSGGRGFLLAESANVMRKLPRKQVQPDEKKGETS